MRKIKETIRVLKLIKEDAERDVGEFDGKPFLGCTRARAGMKYLIGSLFMFIGVG